MANLAATWAVTDDPSSVYLAHDVAQTVAKNSLGMPDSLVLKARKIAPQEIPRPVASGGLDQQRGKRETDCHARQKIGTKGALSYFDPGMWSEQSI